MPGTSPASSTEDIYLAGIFCALAFAGSTIFFANGQTPVAIIGALTAFGLGLGTYAEKRRLEEYRRGRERFLRRRREAAASGSGLRPQTRRRRKKR
ncbi:MAG: hypothetical protein R3F20_10740 [Planctomycetota bacterium]